MKPKWYFNERRACDRIRDSANDAFFTAESLENLSEALVRESIQNSLDAAQRDQQGIRQVTVRISYVPNATVEVRNYLFEKFSSAKENFEQGVGFTDIRTLFGADCGYIALEDFGTKGLTGDTNDCRLQHAEQNAFFNFFRAEGLSAKSGENLGRWGIGKQVFPTASRLHAMFGLSVRRDTPSRVLMGSAVLRTHSIADADYQPDGWFGCRNSSNDPVSPISDNQFIDDFANIFGLARANNPGLSIVVPVVDERVSEVDLRRGIVRSFFWPILSGELTVDLETPCGKTRIDHETLAHNCDLLPPGEAAVVDFAGWASTAKPCEKIKLPPYNGTKPDWRCLAEKLLPDSKLDEMRALMEKQLRVGVIVPVRVRPKAIEKAEAASYFTVYIEPCRDSGYRPIFLRDGIVVTDVRCPHMPGTRALVVIDDPPLAGLLGDAEGVNHTQWQKDSPKFHNHYYYGGETIRFVSRSVTEIMQRLHGTETKGNPNLLLDIFYLPTDNGTVEPGKKPTKGTPGTTPEPRPPIPPPTPKKFMVENVKGGFHIRPGNAAWTGTPFQLRIEAGYAVRRGDAIKRWAPDDFNFIKLPLKREIDRGVIVRKGEGNLLELEVIKQDFELWISGFDTRRDLVVHVNEIRSENETDV